jgi:type II secretory pathway pseudopilin PulG
MKSSRVAGFTLLETVVVMSISAAIVLAIPPMLQWLRQQGVHHALEQLQADLQLARVTAIRQKQVCTVRFNIPAMNQYVNMSNGRMCDLKAYRGDVHFLNQGPDGKKMAAAVNFNSRGMSTSVAATDIFLADGAGLSTYRIRILLPGGISVDRWNGHDWY